jgi:hypothetical protein
MDPTTRRFLLWLSWQLAVFGAYGFYRTRRPVGVAIALAQIVISTPLGSVMWLLSFQFAPGPVGSWSTRDSSKRRGGSGAQCDGWCRRAGFARTEILPLTGPTSAAIAYK